MPAFGGWQRRPPILAGSSASAAEVRAGHPPAALAEERGRPPAAWDLA